MKYVKRVLAYTLVIGLALSAPALVLAVVFWGLNGFLWGLMIISLWHLCFVLFFQGIKP